jgi:butyryl-CoA dehydrogenase
MVKLAASEAAARVVDACVQLFGGRGYMADSPVERLFRSLRGERIWEGTSDIQRVVIARHIEKRGLASLIGSSAAQAETALV